MTSSPRQLNALFIVSTVICLVTTIIFFILASTSLGRENLFPHGIFRSDSYQHPSKLTPAKWISFTVWILVFTFQLSWVLYAHSLFCRKNGYQLYFYEDPPFLPQSFYAFYILSLTMVTLLLFVQDNDYTAASLVSVSAATFCLTMCIYILAHLLWLYEDRLSKADIWVTVIFVQNGLGLFATWCWLSALLFHLDAILVKEAGMSVEDSATVCLSCVLLLTVIYVCADMYLSKKWLRYFLSPYMVLMLTVVGIIQDTWEDGDRTSYILVGLLCTVLAASLAKLGAIVYWTQTEPLSIEVTVY